MVGQQPCCVAEYQGSGLSLLGWSAPARCLRPATLGPVGRRSSRPPDVICGQQRSAISQRRCLLRKFGARWQAQRDTALCIACTSTKAPSPRRCRSAGALHNFWSAVASERLASATPLSAGPARRPKRRRQWGIESVCHQRLDVSLHQDKSRVRSVSGVAVQGVEPDQPGLLPSGLSACGPGAGQGLSGLVVATAKAAASDVGSATGALFACMSLDRQPGLLANLAVIRNVPLRVLAPELESQSLSQVRERLQLHPARGLALLVCS